MLMLIRRVAAVSLLTLVLAGCARSGSQPSASTSSPVSSSSSPAPSSSSSPGGGTISGVVQAGIEPHCLVLRDSSGSHVLAFGDASLRAEVKVGAKLTLTGRADPKMMSTCQQGVVFVVTSVSPAS